MLELVKVLRQAVRVYLLSCCCVFVDIETHLGRTRQPIASRSAVTFGLATRCNRARKKTGSRAFKDVSSQE